MAQINGSEWAISSRGFNSRFANKLLVLIDGRTVYTPAFAGVDWAVQNVMLEDVERIEVIRGPGGDRLGRQRRQRRNQHHHQVGQGDAWRSGDRRRRHV